jgi:hypothetical protein
MNYLAFKIYLIKYLSTSSNGNTSVLNNCLFWFNIIIDINIYIYLFIIYIIYMVFAVRRTFKMFIS